MRKKTLTLWSAGAALACTAGFLLSRKLTKVGLARSPAEGTFVEVDGVRLHVLQRGLGPDVLLIHGAAMMGAEMMLALGDAFPGCRVTSIDRPGHGHSDKRRRPSVVDQASLVRAAAVELGLESPVVVGHSLGGAVALAYGEQFADEVSGVVTIAPLAFPGWGPAHAGRAIRGAPLIGPALSNTVQALADPVMMRAAMRLIFSPQKPTAGFRETVDLNLLARPSAMVADGADFVRASMDLEQMSRRYDSYPVPLHVIVGERDHVLNPGRQGERLAKTVPNCGLTLLPGLGHMAHHFEPGAVTTAAAIIRSRAGVGAAAKMAA